MGTITIWLDQSRFACEKGSIAIGLAMLEIGEGEGSQIVFRVTGAPECGIFTTDNRILNDYFILRRNGLRGRTRAHSGNYVKAGAR
ncbi:MAG: hypothetical protein RMH97_06135 [Verrucomicrobiales bacterium]|nr:hypothetical protein [Verrucomicrobiales bacterium]